MAQPKYSLQTCLQARVEGADRAARDLGSALQAARAAELSRTRAEQQREEHERAASAVRDSERAALDRGALTVFDLALAAVWSIGAAETGRRLDAATEGARAAEGRAREVERQSRARAEARHADAEVLVRHRSRWAERERKAEEGREEQSALEAWRPRK